MASDEITTEAEVTSSSSPQLVSTDNNGEEGEENPLIIQKPEVLLETSIKTESKRLWIESSLCFLSYYALAFVIYVLNEQAFDGSRKNGNIWETLVDGLYFSTITLTSIGFGDIVPASNGLKICVCFLIILGTCLVYRVVESLIDYLIQLQELRGGSRWWHHPLVQCGLGFSMLFVEICVMRWVEGMTWMDCFYSSIVATSTVGFGDKNLKTLVGRFFAAVWFVLPPIFFGRGFAFLVSLRIESSREMIKSSILNNKNEGEPWIPHNASGAVQDVQGRKAMFAVHKLLEMGLVTREDVVKAEECFDELEKKKDALMSC